MSFKKSSHFLFFAFTIVFVVATSCKKPRNGNYNYEETGTKKTYLKENTAPFVLTKTTDISVNEKVKVKNKKDVLTIGNIVWQVNGDSATNRGNTSSTTPPSTTFKSHYSYCGIITNKKTIEGVFKRVQVTTSFNNVVIDSSSGTFRYQRD